MQIKQTLRIHAVAVILALLTSIITALPQIYFRFDQKEIYQGIELLPDSPWSARAREIQDGHTGFGSIYYKDGKDNPYLFQPLGSMVVGYMGKIFSFDINNTLLLSRLSLPFVIFLLIYSFVFLISKSKLASLSSASVLLLADAALSFSGIRDIFQGVSPDSFLRIARPVNPAMIYILFFGFLLSFFYFYKKRDWKSGVLSAVLLSLNFYNYFYSWTFLYAFGVILVLLFFLQKKWREGLSLGSVFLGALIFLVPYAKNLYQASTYPVYEEISLRFGVIATHASLFVGFVVVGALIVYFLGSQKEDRDTHLFGLALLLAPFVTMNQQLLTGRILQPAHYHWFFHKPLAAIFVLVVLFYSLSRWRFDFLKKALGVAIIVVSFGVGIFVQADSYFHDERDGGRMAIERQKYGPVMEWLNENVEKDAVVLADNEPSHITVIYTPLNVFYHRAAIYTLSATKERLREVLFTFYRLRGVGADEAREVFFQERGHLSWNIYGMYYRELLGSYEAIPDEKVEKLVEEYIETLQTPTPLWLKQVFSKYEVEYTIWDKKSSPEWNLDTYAFLEEAALYGDIAIFRFVGDNQDAQ